jgi:septum formation protein
MDPIILASGSPRRQDFFRLMGLPFTCIPAMIDETPPSGLTPRQAAEELAQRKALAVADRLHSPTPTPHSLLPTPLQWIFAADTIVVLESEIFGKPTGRDDARRMLEQLAGQRHEVITAMALYNGQLKTVDCRSKTSEVAFAPLAGAEIEWYLDTGEWEGAAGAYRLQGLGACLIEAVNGSPSGVAGLPLYDFYGMLRDNGYPYGRL